MRSFRLFLCALGLLGLFFLVPVTHAHVTNAHVSSGHALAFHADHWTWANGRNALRVQFQNANVVAPQTTADAFRVYTNLWDGITLTYRASPRGIVESVYELAPFANPDAIRLHYSAPIAVNANGALTISFPNGQLTESAPLAWQMIDGASVPIAISFAQTGTQDLAFAVGAYDPAHTLYIDPTLTWNTFVGSTDGDVGYAIAVDGSGNSYVTGRSDAAWGAGPVNAYQGAIDAFVAKFDSSGNLVWHTFLGSSTALDVGHAIVFDNDVLYVAGISRATWGSPERTYSGGFQDGFAAALNATTGALVWNTFLGGSGDDDAEGITIDSNDNVYVSGGSDTSWGSTIIDPHTGGGKHDAYAVKLNSSGAFQWVTFYGGTEYDFGEGICVDSADNIVMVGSSGSTWGSPVRAFTDNFGAADGFVVKFDADGNTAWNTFLGGLSDDGTQGVDTDGSDNIYVSGNSGDTWGSPVRAFTTGDTDVFAAKLDSDGNLQWNTFLGSSDIDQAEGIAADGAGNSFVIGSGYDSWGSPWDAFDSREDAFVAKLGTAGNLVWNAFFGGEEDDEGEGIALDSTSVYLTGSSEASWGNPVNAYTAGTDGTSADAFVAKISDAPTAVNVTGVRGAINKNGNIVLRWKTTSETQIAGFNIYRQGKQGEWKQINNKFRQAKHAGAALGDKYRFIDRTANAGKTHRYKIQVVYLDGHTEWTKVVKVDSR